MPSWALEHPQEYALIYGSPVPGYHAPSTTVGPASRLTSALTGLLLEAHRAGRLRAARVETLSPSLETDMERLTRTAALQAPAATVAMGLVAWALLFGQISFEVFGRLDEIVQDAGALFEHAVTATVDLVGLIPA